MSEQPAPKVSVESSARDVAPIDTSRLRWPLRWQILLPYLLVTGFAIVGLTLLSARIVGRLAEEQLDQRMRGMASVVSAANFPLTDAVLAQIRGLSGAELAVLSADDKLLATTSPQLVAAPAAGPFLLAGERYRQERIALTRTTDSSAATLIVLSPEARYRQAVRQAIAAPLAIGALTLLLSSLGGAWLARRIEREVQTLRGNMLALAAGEFTQFPLPETNDELRDLALGLNDASRRLAEYREVLRRTERGATLAQVAAGVAHELRNAVTGCRLALDLHRERCQHTGDDSLPVVQRQLEWIDDYVRRFLQLSTPAPAGQKQAIDLVEVTQAARAMVAPFARHHQIELEVNVPSAPVMLVAHSEAMTQALVNLLINAIQAVAANPPDSLRRVTLSLFNSPAELAIDVADTGPGIPADLADSLAEPFVTTKPDGVGLGLSLVRSVAIEHAGTLSWRRDNDCTIFTLTFPYLNNEEKRIHHREHRGHRESEFPMVIE
jgi:signal transduction histidine kinase